MTQGPIAFMSYVRRDDHHEQGKLSEFRARLSGEVRMQTGGEFHIFQDKDDIKWGQQWKERIEESLDGTTFLIPIITPGFFKSEACRDELERFIEREKRLGRGDLILPVYYVACPILDNEAEREKDPLAKTIASRHYADWRELRFEPFTEPRVGRTFADMARQIVKALERNQSPVPEYTRAVPPTAAPRTILTPEATTDQAGNALHLSLPSYARSPVAKTEPPIRIVDALHRGDHTTLSDAVRSAQPGDRILVRPGLYREGVVIDKPIEIIGDGDLGEVVIEATGKDVVLFRANMGRIVNLTLRQAGGGGWFGVDITQGRLDLESCDITSRSLSCVTIRGGADPRLRRNRIHDGKQSGVFVYENGQGTLEDNDIFANEKAGVAIKTGGNPTLRRNRIHDGKQSGVFVYENGQGTLEDNDIFANENAGVVIETGGNPTLRRNRIHDGKQGGVFVRENGQGTLEDNDIFANTLAGVVIETGGNPTLRRNRIHDGKRSGVFVYVNGQGTLEDNDIFANEKAGVAIETGGNPTLRRNRISRNGYEAVWVYKGGAGVVEDNDLRGNKRGPWDIAEDCLSNVKRNGNRES